MKVALIPARGGSKSIPIKNIKLFFGKPLIYWNLNSLENSSVEAIYVATDSEEIKQIVKSFNFSKVVIYDRDPKNAQDSSSTESLLLEFLSKEKFQEEDYLFLVQITSPFTTSYDFDQAFEQLKAEQSDSLLSATLSKRFFWNKEGSPINYDYKNRPRRQDFEGLFMENGAFYINKVSNILNHKNRLSGIISIYEMPEYTSLELDEPSDWVIAEQIMKTYSEAN